MENSQLKTTEIFSNANWISTLESEYEVKGRSHGGIETAYFRLKFNLPRAVRLDLSISASSRYRLWVNGRDATYGPCRVDR